MTAPRSAPHSVFQIGAAGGVGRRLAVLLHAEGHRVTGMHRAIGQDAVIRAAGATPVMGDLVGDSVDAWPSGWPGTTQSSSAPVRTAPAWT